jgi:IS5 family transposase
LLGSTDPQLKLLDADEFCGHLVPADSIYRKLAELGDRLFSDADFADMYDIRGRHSIPPSLLAKVLLLQTFDGTSDRDTLHRVRCDLGWKVALHLSVQDEGFHHTVLTYFRERLRRSERPRRIFERFKEVATEAGLLTKRGTRVLDSTPILSAVQAEDTVSMIRSAMRRLLALLDVEIRQQADAVLRRSDYDQLGKPAIDWDDESARVGLVDDLGRDALAVLAMLEGTEIGPDVAREAETLATVTGQDLEWDEQAGRFRIRRGVARDRVISTVDPEARHGRKSNHGHFNGYKAHVAVDPETELISEIEVTPANVSDGAVAPDLLPELAEGDAEITAVGDSAYGSGPTRTALTEAGATVIAKAPPEQNSTGGFPKSAFTIDLTAGAATCPAGVTTTDVSRRADGMHFQFPAAVCAQCRLRGNCTSSARGRSLHVGPYEAVLAEARSFQRTEAFKTQYNGNRPTVERSISRLVRRGGRKARHRGRLRVQERLELKAAAENFARMTRMGLIWTGPDGWGLALTTNSRHTEATFTTRPATLARLAGRIHSLLGQVIRLGHFQPDPALCQCRYSAAS